MEHNYIINFCYTLYKYANKFCSNEYGLNTSSSEKVTFIKNKQYEIMELFLFNNNGLLILNYNFSNNIELLDKKQKNIELSIIQRTLINLKKINQVKKNFITYTIYLRDYKIIYLFQNNQILVGKFQDNINNYYCHLCLKFIYISLINFKFDINEKISMLYTNIDDNNNLKYKLKAYKNIDDLYKNQNNVNINENEKKLVSSYNNDSSEEQNNENSKNWKIFSFNDYLEIKIYEKYFLKYLVLHFNKIFDLIIHKEELILFNIKLKNVYFIDLERQEIIFDFQRINNKKIKNIKYYNQEKIFKQCLLIAKKLENEYKNNLNPHSKLEYVNVLTENFGKFECTSTFPRICFYIKYLPVLTGIAIIHIYSQKKLSRQIEQHSLNTNNNLKNKFCISKKNIKLLNYYYEFISVISNNNIKGDDTLKYYEPAKIFDIQKFFFEFFIASTKQNDIYYYILKNRVAKYFNKTILNTINSVPSSILKEKSLEKVFIQINLKLENLFLKLFLNDKKNNNAVEKQNENQKELNNITKAFEIEEEFILFDLFKDLVKKRPNCLVKFDTNINMNNTNSNKKSFLFSIKDLNSVYPTSNFITDNSEEYLISKEKKENGNKYLKKSNLIKKDTSQKKDYSKKSTLKFSDNNISSFELDDSSINMHGISRKVSIIFENNNKLNRKEFFNHRQKSFFEETDSENNQVNYPKKIINDKYGNFKRVMTYENGNTLVKYSCLKLGKKYDKNIASKKMDVLGFSGVFGKANKKKDF